MSTRFEVLRIALGTHQIGQWWQKPQRNHFEPAESIRAICDELVDAGLLSRSCRLAINGCYHVTQDGRRVALHGLTFRENLRYGYGSPVNR